VISGYQLTAIANLEQLISAVLNLHLIVSVDVEKKENEFTA